MSLKKFDLSGFLLQQFVREYYFFRAFCPKQAAKKFC